ncbi:hypothetical protein [Azospirillum formosense]|uniref:hypothetical protein n=1 Tax=Azospirillum formosense TaxID=861533 RepID=UPI00339063EC
MAAFLGDLVTVALPKLTAALLAWAPVGFIVWKPRLTWPLLAFLPGGIAAIAVYASTGTVSRTALVLIVLTIAPAAPALRWAARRLW